MRANLLPGFFAALIGLVPIGTASGETLNWRLATVVVDQQAGETVRRGAAIFSNGEPAFVTLRLRPTAPPAQGRMPFATHSLYRFEDGSTFTVVGTGVAAMSPEGVPLPVENLIEGRVTEGTGRFAGISGTVALRSRSGMDRTSPGVLGDQFAAGQADVSLPR